jgi:hypothetical protein
MVYCILNKILILISATKESNPLTRANVLCKNFNKNGGFMLTLRTYKFSLLKKRKMKNYPLLSL